MTKPRQARSYKLSSRKTWTKRRIEVSRLIRELAPRIVPAGLNEWLGIQRRVMERFTGRKSPLVWAWENGILPCFPRAGGRIDRFWEATDAISACVPAKVRVWLFLEDRIGERRKYWTYSGFAADAVLLLKEYHEDFYLVDVHCGWLMGLDHSDVLFAYGSAAPALKRHFTARAEACEKGANHMRATAF